MYAEWMLAPSGYYIGLLRVGNKHYYSSGRTADHLERNLKFSAYQNERISASQVHLAHEKSDSIDISKASKMFYTKYIKAREGTGTKTVVTKTHIVNEPKPVFEHITEIDKETGELVVYKLIEVSRFKLRKTNTETNDIQTPVKQEQTKYIEPTKILFDNEIDAA